MDARIDSRKCCCTPVEQVRDKSGAVVVLWCTRCNWTYDFRSDEEMPQLDEWDDDKAKRLINDLLNPEALGFSVSAEIRDRARECKGLEPVERGS